MVFIELENSRIDLKLDIDQSQKILMKNIIRFVKTVIRFLIQKGVFKIGFKCLKMVLLISLEQIQNINKFFIIVNCAQNHLTPKFHLFNFVFQVSIITGGKF